MESNSFVLETGGSDKPNPIDSSKELSNFEDSNFIPKTSGSDTLNSIDFNNKIKRYICREIVVNTGTRKYKTKGQTYTFSF